MTKRERNLFIQATKFLEETYKNAPEKYHTMSGRNVKYRFEHSMRVFNIACDLAKRENANVLVCGMAAILHDVAKFEADELNTEHTTLGAIMAKPFLETLDLTSEEINKICYAISAHSNGDSAFGKIDSREAILLQASDDIDRFDYIKTYTIINNWHLGELSIDDAIKKINNEIAMLNNELKNVHTTTDYVQDLLIDHIKSQINYFKELLRQYNNSRSIKY